MRTWGWKRVLKEVAVTAVLVVVISNVISYIRQPSLQSDRLPLIHDTLIGGEEFSTKGMEQKPLMVHFWATWCPVCKAEIDNIERLSHYYNVITIAVNSGSDQEIKTFMKERGLSFAVINDQEGAWAGSFGVKGYPTTFIYDTDGVLQTSQVGYTSTAGLALRMWLAD